ncbi:Pka-R2 [Symbiodinium sp. CCMP2592]|nr:Pka-R2 [Symbiodinium sp. CCMP2592]
MPHAGAMAILGRKASRARSQTGPAVASWQYVEELQVESDLGVLGSGATSGDDLALPVVPPAIAHLSNRRGGVSAEPAGANNVRWAEWTAPFYRKSEEHRIKLLCAVRTCPIFQGVEERDLHTIVDAIEVVSFQPRDTIYTKGEYGRSGFVLISGQVIAEAEDVDQSDNIFRRSKSRWVTFEEGQFFGEHTMLWGFTRRVTMTTSEGCVVGKLRRDAYFNIVTRSAMRTRSLKEKYLRQAPSLKYAQVLSDPYGLGVLGWGVGGGGGGGGGGGELFYCCVTQQKSPQAKGGVGSRVLQFQSYGLSAVHAQASWCSCDMCMSLRLLLTWSNEQAVPARLVPHCHAECE